MEEVASDSKRLLRLTEDGAVSAGNLEGLVSRVIDGTTDPPGDERFRTTFLTIYQLFSTSERLLEILKKRFKWAGLDPTDTRSQYSYVNILPGKICPNAPSLSILLFIESWLEKGFEDEDLSCSSKIREFALAVFESGSQELKAKAAGIASMIYDPDFVSCSRPSITATLTVLSGLPPPTKRHRLATT
jgi:hypothetical protein